MRYDGRSWHVDDPEMVIAALADARLHVELASTGHGRLDDVKALMARFSEGDAHARRRAWAVDALERVDADRLGARAGELTHVELRRSAVRFDVMPLARRVPALALGEAVGFDSPRAMVEAAARVTAALAPPLDAAPVDATSLDRALDTLVGPRPSDGQAIDEQRVALVALLHQARDATAGLVAAALVSAATVTDAVRDRPPVTLTTRVAASPVELDGQALHTGARLTVHLDGAPFGGGRHACPGRAHALAVASAIVDAVRAEGWRCAAGHVIEHEPRANQRIPRELWLTPV